MNQVPLFRESDGSLGVIEFAGIPFTPQRFFWIFDACQAEVRADHAHRTCHQYLFCQSGRIRARLTTGSDSSSTHDLVPGNGLHISPLTWLELFDFSDDAVLGVLASEPYRASEYILDRAELADLWQLAPQT